MTDVTRHLAPGLLLYITPSGWYTLDWELKPGVTPNIDVAIRNLEVMIEYGNLPPATGPRKYHEDKYRTAEEVLEDLRKHADVEFDYSDDEDDEALLALAKERLAKHKK